MRSKAGETPFEGIDADREAELINTLYRKEIKLYFS